MIEEDYQRIVVREHEKVIHNQSYFYKLAHAFYDEDQHFEKHWHNSIEINYSVNGIAIQEIDNQKIVMETGDMILINSRVFHDVYVKSPFEGIVLFVDRKYIDYNCPNAKDKSFNLNLNLKAKKQVEKLLLKLVDTYESGNRIRSHIIVLEII